MNHDFYLYAGKIWKNAGGRALILPILSETDMWIIRLLVMRSSASFRSRGYRVGIISQPDWKDPESICIYGEPRLGFLVSAGNMDSMVNHYSVSKKRRRTDAYTPGGEMGKRPDHACVVYGNLIRQKYKKDRSNYGRYRSKFKTYGTL